MYHNNSSVQDVQDAIDNAEAECRNLRQANLEDVIEVLEDVESAISGIESELNYVATELEDLKEELEELEEWEEIIEEYGTPADLPLLTEEEWAEYAKLKENARFFKRDKEQMERIVVERDNLREAHAKQRDTIQKLFDKLAGLHDQTSLDSVLLVTLDDLPVADDKQVLVIDVSKLPNGEADLKVGGSE